METVRRVLRDLGCEGKETWVLFNKWDGVPAERVIEARHLESTLMPGERPFFISAERGDGLEALREALLARLGREEKTVELFVPHERGDVVAYVRENGRVLESEYRTDGVFLRAAFSPARLAKLRNLFPAGFPGESGNGEESWERA
jgi:GTP-binding protein HflX